MKQTIKINESQLRKIVKESLNEYIRGIRPGARYGNKNFNVKTLINEVERALDEIDRQCDYLIKLSSQLPGDIFNNDFDSELNRYAGNIDALNHELTDKFWKSIKGVQINESKSKKAIKEALDLQPYDGFSVNTSTGEDNNGVYGYHAVSDKATAAEIMRNGFKVHDTGEGNCLGKGIYLFANLNDAMRNSTFYGNLAIKAKIISNNFQKRQSHGSTVYIVPNANDVVPVQIISLNGGN